MHLEAVRGHGLIGTRRLDIDDAKARVTQVDVSPFEMPRVVRPSMRECACQTLQISETANGRGDSAHLCHPPFAGFPADFAAGAQLGTLVKSSTG